MKISTRFVKPLDDEQVETLNNMMNNDSSARTRKQAHGILLSSKGYGTDAISDISDFHRDSVSTWTDDWEEQGVQGLFDKPGSGAPAKLTESEIELVKKLINETPASPKTVLAKIFEQTGKIISKSALKRIAKAAGLCWKRVGRSLKGKRDEEESEKAKEDIQKLKQQEKSGDIDLFYFDEAGFNPDPSVPYAYQPVGETLEIPASSSKRLNVLGFYSTNNILAPFRSECSADTDIVVACFNEFAKTVTKKTVVIPDNAPVHHSYNFESNISEWEKKGLILKYIPPCSPELNLTEILWRFIKYYRMPFAAYLSFENLVQAVENILRGIGKEYNISFA